MPIYSLPSTPERVLPDENCALDANGNLLSASKIAFFNSPSDEHPIQAPPPHPPSPTPRKPESPALGVGRRKAKRDYVSLANGVDGDEVRIDAHLAPVKILTLNFFPRVPLSRSRSMTPSPRDHAFPCPSISRNLFTPRRKERQLLARRPGQHLLLP
jgi:hypothetical protein